MVFSLAFSHDQVQCLSSCFAVGFLLFFGPPRAIEARPPSLRSSVFSPAPGAGTSRLEMKPFERKHVRQVDKSSPRLAARDGMEQGPYEFQRTRTALASEPKGKATHGEVRSLPRFKEFESGYSDCALALSRGLFAPQIFAGKCRASFL